MKKRYSPNADWLRLLETNALTVAALDAAYPQGVKSGRPERWAEMRRSYHFWRETVESLRFARRKHPDAVAQAELTHKEWIRQVLLHLLEWQETYLSDATGECPELVQVLPDAQTIQTVRYQNAAKLIFASFAPTVDSDALQAVGNALARHLRACIPSGSPRIALITNGEYWILVSVQENFSDALITWRAGDWFRERGLYDAFEKLLSLTSICKGDLQGLLEEAAKNQDDVTDKLGEQVQRAVEVLVQSLDKADSGRSFIGSIHPGTLYEAALTIMMRLVFILCAEERHLLPFGDPVYDANYAMSTLRETLRGQAETVSEETLERRYDAWGRLLSLCRIIHGGSTHPDLRIPALGGSIFDPEKFPFLEGRGADGKILGNPLPIDNRTFLYLLEALQVINHANGVEIVPYGALDVEQIGHVYEGLLELRVERAEEVTLRLEANQNALAPEQTLARLESLLVDGVDDLVAEIKIATNVKSDAKIRKNLAKEIEPEQYGMLCGVCGDESLARRVKPFLNLLKRDAWGRPIVYQKGAFMVTAGGMRRNTGAYYTPRSLTEPIVKTTLEPQVYVGPAEGLPEAEWKLKSPAELLDLKVCDPAMGSGAFLVQSCRYLSEKLCEAWKLAEAQGKVISADGQVLDEVGSAELLSKRAEDRLIKARRLIAERCLYGVDKNPLAVELAKLSIWLVTLSQDRPFAFLDHCLGCGDSLLGVDKLEDIYALSEGEGLFSDVLRQSIEESIAIRRQLRHAVIRDIGDVHRQADELANARRKIAGLDLIADVLILDKVRNAGKKTKKNTLEGWLAQYISSALDGDESVKRTLEQKRAELWMEIQGEGIESYRPFHWCLKFPEVAEKGGFNAVVGNPPFIGNAHWLKRIGECANKIATLLVDGPVGKVDISVIFHRRGFDLISRNGTYGLISTKSISEGVAVKCGLSAICRIGDIYCCEKSFSWPGKANVNVAIVHCFKGEWGGLRYANGTEARSKIPPTLCLEQNNAPFDMSNDLDVTKGVDSSHIDDVVIDDLSIVKSIMDQDSKIVLPLINGVSINSSSMTEFRKYVVDTRDRTLEQIKDISEAAYDFLISRQDKRINSINLSKEYESWCERWWQHWRTRIDYINKNGFSDALCYCIVTKYPIPRHVHFVVPTHSCIIFAVSEQWHHVLSLSSPFAIWLSSFTGAKKRK